MPWAFKKLFGGSCDDKGGIASAQFDIAKRREWGRLKSAIHKSDTRRNGRKKGFLKLKWGTRREMGKVSLIMAKKIF